MTQTENETPAGMMEADTHGEAIVARQVVARDFSQFVAFLEDGQVNADLAESLLKISTQLQDRAHMAGPKVKQKAKLTLTLDFCLEGGVFEIVSKITEKLPEDARPRSIMWTNSSNQFTPQNMRQLDMWNGPKGV